MLSSDLAALTLLALGRLSHLLLVLSFLLFVHPNQKRNANTLTGRSVHTQACSEHLVLWQGYSKEECSWLMEDAMTFDADQ